MRYHFCIVAAVIMLVHHLNGCVPYPVSSEASVSTSVTIDQELILTLSPREYLEDFADEITRKHANIEVVDGFLFRDTAFPEGGWKLKQLLQPDTCSRVKAALELDYVVILGQEETLEGDVKGVFIPFFGAGTQKLESRVSAAVLDITSRKFECQINVEAEGHAGAIFVVIVGGAAQPLTKSSAIKGLAAETGNVIDELAGSEKTRIAVVAAAAPLKEPNEPE